MSTIAPQYAHLTEGTEEATERAVNCAVWGMQDRIRREFNRLDARGTFEDFRRRVRDRVAEMDRPLF